MVAFAHRAEELGLDSLWVPERILRPVPPAREPLLAAFVNVILLFWLMTFVVGAFAFGRSRRRWHHHGGGWQRPPVPLGAPLHVAMTAPRP